MSMQIRRLHAYIGMLIAPAVIFFAATGLLQIYNLHEKHPGYAPPPLIEKLSAIHKDQRFAPGHDHPPDGDAPSHSPLPVFDPSGSTEAPHGDGPGDFNVASALLKAFFALVAVGLIFSTVLGIWMAFQQRTRRLTYLVLLLIGSLLPAILAAMTT